MRGRRGFALLLTLTLLAFVVLLLVGLATYTRVETAIAGNMQRQAQARENALLALNVALEQLQKHAGPDTRVTATAAGLGDADAQKRHYTGVWDSTNTELAPIAWLASGAETGAGIDITAAIPPARRATLVGARTDGSPNNTFAELQDIQTPGVPGQGSQAVIGQYAWWIGDQGVKAPVAVADSLSAINYAPWTDGDATDLRTRIQQQLARGAGAATRGVPAFEPRDPNNASLMAGGKVTTANQLAFLRTPGNSAVGLATARANFHAWSPNNFAVLANTKAGGLRQDLSLRPDFLGSGFSAWADYSSYMEPVGATAEPSSISPAYGNDPLRRRYRMTEAINAGGVQHSVAPVLTYFLLSFSVGTANNSGGAAAVPLEVRARWMFSLWNPYTGALVPEDLRVEIAGLPQVVSVVNEATSMRDATIPLRTTFGDPLRISLPWGASGEPTSWLPGRVHTWAALPDDSNAIPSDGYLSGFDTRDVNTSARSTAVQRLLAESANGRDDYVLSANAATLTIRLYVTRSDGDVLLKTFTSPAFEAFGTAPGRLNGNTWQFSYLFRLAESLDTAEAPETWLLGPRRDPRRPSLGASAFVAGPEGPRPEQYVNYVGISSPDRLLDRGSASFDEDVPVFELPRSPILSVGMLQHLPRSNRRAFGIGNSWGRFGTLNDVPMSELFDRYFFSGMGPEVTPVETANGLVLPNPMLRTLRDSATLAQVTPDDLRNAEEGRSSKHLLQGAAFNVNSTNAEAWAAVLRSQRAAAESEFRYLDADAATGTAGDGETDAVPRTAPNELEPAVGDALFFRFPQSAQETYKTGDTDTSIAGTKNFRKGVRALKPGEIATLADRIVGLIKARHAALGPFRSLEEFLTPLPDSIVEDDEEAPDPDGSIVATFGQSLLERAIANAGLNAGEFSSQWLTQGDVMAALAPVLFPRSDTFLIRTYGAAVNPATGAVEGKAWCEAVVQRVPEYVDPVADDATVLPADLQSELNKRYGRRFKIVSFRWLTLSDI